jgi:uncharacterized repeat protein (TIGR03803 family)
MKLKQIILRAITLVICALGFSAHGDAAFTNLFSFSGTNGITPEGELLQTSDGNLYGTARDTTLEKWGNGNFGFNGNGAVFKITTNGEFSTLATFVRSKTNGAFPRAGLALGEDGNLYGTTTGGGANRKGTVFKITTNGILTILVSFDGTNGSDPSPGNRMVKDRDNSFYGTTFDGGLQDSRLANIPNIPHGWGTVFHVSAEGLLKTLVFFDMTNGARPNNGLIRGNDGNLYGTTSYGGLNNTNHLSPDEGGDGLGTVFKISSDGSLSTLHVFKGVDGTGPSAIRQALDGTLYGITVNDGATNTANPYEVYAWRPFTGAGTIFKISPTGKFTTLVLFYGANGKNPDSFILGNDGNFYGTTEGGGANNLGTIFKLTLDGKFTTLYSFTEGSGSWPNLTSLIKGEDGNLYGTTTRRGKNQCGSIFRLVIKQ